MSRLWDAHATVLKHGASSTWANKPFLLFLLRFLSLIHAEWYLDTCQILPRGSTLNLTAAFNSCSLIWENLSSDLREQNETHSGSSCLHLFAYDVHLSYYQVSGVFLFTASTYAIPSDDIPNAQASCEAACEKAERQNAKLRHSLKQNSSLERGQSAAEKSGMVCPPCWFWI